MPYMNKLRKSTATIRRQFPVMNNIPRNTSINKSSHSAESMTSPPAQQPLKAGHCLNTENTKSLGSASPHNLSLDMTHSQPYYCPLLL